MPNGVNFLCQLLTLQYMLARTQLALNIGVLVLSEALSHLRNFLSPHCATVIVYVDAMTSLNADRC